MCAQAADKQQSPISKPASPPVYSPEKELGAERALLLAQKVRAAATCLGACVSRQMRDLTLEQVHVHSATHTHTHTRMHTRMHMHMHMRMHMHMHMRMDMDMYMHMYMCMYMDMYMCTCTK